MRAYFFCILLESKIRVQVTERWGVEISTQYKKKTFLHSKVENLNTKPLAMGFFISRPETQLHTHLSLATVLPANSADVKGSGWSSRFSFKGVCGTVTFTTLRYTEKNSVLAYFGDIAGSVLDHHNKRNIKASYVNYLVFQYVQKSCLPSTVG